MIYVFLIFILVEVGSIHSMCSTCKKDLAKIKSKLGIKDDE